MKWDLPINTSFERARRREVYGRLAGLVRRGRNADLLPLDDVKRRVRLFDQTYVGVLPIPVMSVVGTATTRSGEFDKNFLPRRPEVRERWTRLEHAFPEGEFPPIAVYKVGDSYFVIDGHHRVAVARARGVEFIDAEITELRPRFKIPPGADVGQLIHSEQKALFIEESELDRSFPDASIEFSRPHGYKELLELIKAHGYELSLERKELVPMEEASRDWYENVYAPTVEAIKREGLLAEFEDATESDVFLWIYERRRSLFPECGHLDLEDVVRDVREEKMTSGGARVKRALKRPLGSPREESTTSD